MFPWRRQIFRRSRLFLQPGQHWRIACVSQRSKYMALGMKQISWVLHNHRPDSLLVQAF